MVLCAILFWALYQYNGITCSLCRHVCCVVNAVAGFGCAE